MISATEFAVVSFATYRASRAIAIDTITAPFRHRLDEWSLGRGGWRRKIYELMTCGYCSGFWLSGITYLVYIETFGITGTPVLIHLILWWAVAGLQSMLIAIDSFLLKEAAHND